MGAEQIFALIEAGAFDPENFPVALQRAAELLGASSAYVMCLQDISSRNRDAPAFFVTDASEAAVRNYQSGGWWRVDDRTRFTAQIKERRLILDQQVVPDDVRRKSQMYQEFLRPSDMFWSAQWRVRLDDEEWGIVLPRAEALGLFRAEEEAAIRTIIPALNRALLLSLRLHNVHATGVAAGIHAVGRPTILLDHRGRCCFVSPAAERLFDKSFGIRDGRLWSAHRETADRLDRLALAAADRVSRPRAVVVPREHVQRPLVIVPSRVAGYGLDALPGARLVLMFLDMGASRAPRFDLLQELFGLTPTEARVASDLAAGMTLQSIAERASCKLSSVRQLVKQVLFKTGTHKQASLVALLAKLNE